LVVNLRNEQHFYQKVRNLVALGITFGNIPPPFDKIASQTRFFARYLQQNANDKSVDPQRAEKDKGEVHFSRS